MIPLSARQEFLETIPIFAGLNAEAVSEIAHAVEELEFRADEIIVREDEPGNRMFIIRSGRVEVVKHLGQPRETVLATFGPKDFLGEMSIIECVARAASLRTIDDSFLFSLKGTDLHHLFRHQPDQYAIVILNICPRSFTSTSRHRRIVYRSFSLSGRKEPQMRSTCVRSNSEDKKSADHIARRSRHHNRTRSGRVEFSDW